MAIHEINIAEKQIILEVLEDVYIKLADFKSTKDHFITKSDFLHNTGHVISPVL